MGHKLYIRHVGLCIWLDWLYVAQVINQACWIVCLVRLAVWGTSYKSGMWDCVFG